MNRQDWDNHYRTAELPWKAEPNEFVVHEIGDLTPARALGIACGEGRNAIWLASEGWSVTGVDFSSVALERTRQLTRRRGVELNWIEADITEWQPERRRTTSCSWPTSTSRHHDERPCTAAWPPGDPRRPWRPGYEGGHQRPRTPLPTDPE